MKKIEVRSYAVSFSKLQRPVYWFKDDFEGGTWSEKHTHHAWAELAFTSNGIMVMCSDKGNYLLPPNRAAWIPPSVPHEWYLPQSAADRSLYIDPSAMPAHKRFTTFHAMTVTPLVRELISHLAHFPTLYEPGPIARLVEVLIDQLVELPEEPNPISMPQDRRLVMLCTELMTNPGSTTTLYTWAKQLAMSERNLARLFARETGQSFRQWRHNIRMQHAHSRLKKGEDVTSVGIDCGYSSISAFIEAFKKTFGETPGKIESHTRNNAVDFKAVQI